MTTSHRVTFIVLVLLLAALSGAADWPTFHNDGARTGVTGVQIAEELAVAWTATLGSSVDASPAVVDERVYVGTGDGTVVCVQAAGGEVLWSARTDGCVISSPAVADGTVYVGSTDRCIYAFDALDGTRLWRVRTWKPVVASPLVTGGHVYIGSMDGSFRSLAADTGEQIWLQEGAPISAGAAADEAGQIIYGDESGTLHACNANTGEEIWSRDFDGKIVAPPAIFGNRVVVGVMVPSALKPPKRPYVICLAADTGEILWQKIDAESLLHTPAGDSEQVYFATVSGYTSATRMFALTLEDGEQVWEQSLGGVADCSPALTPDRLLFGNHDEVFHVWNRAGKEVSSVRIGAKLFSSPAVVESGVYFGTGDGRLVCLRRSLADTEALED